jgi:hypothetical protein
VSVVRIGGGLIAVGDDDPDPADRFRAEPVGLTPEQRAAELRQDHIQAMAEAVMTADPPDGLNVKTSDLPSARAMLARIGAWIALLKLERDDLIRGRVALMDKLGVPAMTEAAIAELETADKSGLLQWVRTGARSVLPSLARERERELLREKLAADSYEAEVAKATLETAEEQIDVLEAQIRLLRGAAVRCGPEVPDRTCQPQSWAEVCCRVEGRHRRRRDAARPGLRRRRSRIL